MKKRIRLTESDLRNLVKESICSILQEMEGNHIYSERELQELYDNQDGLSDEERKVLNAAMWIRAMRNNYHGYASRWFNIAVRDGRIYYFGNNGEMKEVPYG